MPPDLYNVGECAYDILFGEGAVREIKWATVDATGPGSAAVPDAALESFWNKFQSAVANNDKEAVASMTRFPLSMRFGKRSIRTRAQLMNSYGKIFEAETRKCFATARPLTESAASTKFSINCGAAMMYRFGLVNGAYKFTAVDNVNE